MAQVNPHLTKRDVFYSMSKLVNKGKLQEFNSKFVDKLKHIPGITPDFWKSDFRTMGGHIAANLKHSTWWYKNRPVDEE